MESIDPIGVLPASTRAIFQFDNTAPGDTTLPDEWLASATLPHQSPVAILNYYSSGVDLPVHSAKLVLDQMTNTDDGFVVIATIASSEAESLFSSVALEEAEGIEGYPLLSVPGTKLFHLQLDDNTLAIANQTVLTQVLSVYQNTSPDIHESVIADHLDTLAAGHSYSFVSGLPALFKPVVAPGSGASSLAAATVVKAAFDIDSNALNDVLVYVSDNAATFTEHLNTRRALGSTPVTITAEGNEVHIDLSEIHSQSQLLSLLKTLHISMDAVDYSEAVAEDGNAPWLNFNVGVSPTPFSSTSNSPTRRSRRIDGWSPLAPGTIQIIQVLPL